MSEQYRSFLLLSGVPYRNYIDFWVGFISIQRSLKTDDNLIILAHTWDKKYRDLISNVYGTEFISFSEFEHNDHVSNSLRFSSEKLDNKKDSPIPNFYYMYNSRKHVIELLESNFTINYNDRIVLTRYDIGYRVVTPEVSTIILDDALPRDYIYMPYYYEIDEGYADQWFIFSLKHLSFFKNLSHYVTRYLSEDSYFDAFSNHWINSIRKNKYKIRFFYVKKIIIDKIVKYIKSIYLKNTNLLRKIEGLTIKLYDNRDLIHGTAEVETLNGAFFSSYPISQSINTHAVLKYAIYQNNLRDDVRFLHYLDFHANKIGRLIAPFPFAVLVYSHSSYSDCWEMTIKQFNENLIYPNYKIYIATEASTNSEKAFKNLGTNVIPIYYDDNLSYTMRLKVVMGKISNWYEVIYFIHEDMPLYNQVDSVYLNSLIKYFIRSNEYYIKLVDTSYVKTKIQHPEFPGLVTNYGLYSLSIQPSLIKPNSFINLINDLDLTIYEFETYMFHNTDSFSAVKGSKRIGKFLYINEFFPHIATALFKGKWTITEWGVNLENLLEVYNIKIERRGKF